MYDILGVLYGLLEVVLNCGKIYYIFFEWYVGMVVFFGVEMKIVGNNGMIVFVGIKGELYICNVIVVFRGYINEFEKMVVVIFSFGWYKMDDFVYINLEGCVEIYGWVFDVLEIGGVKVFFFFIEEIIKKNLVVKEVVVFVVKDNKYFDDIVCVVVVLKNEVILIVELFMGFIKEEFKFFEDVKFL